MEQGHANGDSVGDCPPMLAAEDLKINQGCIVYARRAFVLLLPTWHLKHWLFGG